jgi:hypothetical protein
LLCGASATGRNSTKEQETRNPDSEIRADCEEITIQETENSENSDEVLPVVLPDQVLEDLETSDEVIAVQVLEDLETSDGVVVLRRKDAIGRMQVAAKYMRLPRRNQDANKLTKNRLQAKAKIVETVLRELGEGSEGAILREINRRKGYSVRSSTESTFTIPEAYSQMKMAHCTINQMGVIDSFNRHMRDIFNYPAQFVKRLSAFERLRRCQQMRLAII